MLTAETVVPVEVRNAAGTGQVCLLCEHASSAIPSKYGNLGLAEGHRLSHAVWDLGARELAVCLSDALDAPLVASCLSRLIYDCNRPPEADSAIPDQSELIGVPGNRGLSSAERQSRADLAYWPFCTAVTSLLDARLEAQLPTVVVTVHSFAPVYFGKPRAVEIGVLHDKDTRLADALLSQAHRLPGRVLSRNEPYGPDDGVTHSLKLHAVSRGLANVMLEIRNDLLTDQAGVQQVCADLLPLLVAALADLDESRAYA